MRAGLGVGLIETMRARDGRLPWLERHIARLRASLAALGLPLPPQDLRSLIQEAAWLGDSAVRLEVRDGRAEVSTRGINSTLPPVVIVSAERHQPYPHKISVREQFGRAFANARRDGADDALLLTPRGFVAEGTAWSVFWWGELDVLCTPALDLGILPGIGRSRVMELTRVREVREPVESLRGESLFLVNAVRGIVEIGEFEGEAVPQDRRTAELSSRFWPD